MDATQQSSVPMQIEEQPEAAQQQVPTPTSVADAFLVSMQRMTQTMEQQTQDHASQQSAIQRSIRRLGTAMEGLATQAQVQTPAPISANRIDLAEFTGADRTMWATWEIQARGKALSCGPDPLTQFYTVFNKLRDNAAKNVTPWVTRNLREGTASYEGLLEELGRLYSDPVQQAKALSRLKVMKQQEKESFANFYPKFEKELANAGGSTFQDCLKVMFLQSALNNKYTSCLPSTKHYEDYNELVSDLQNASANLANRDALRPAMGSYRPASYNFVPTATPPPLSVADTPTPMDWTPTNNLTRNVNRPEARWVSKETRQARRDARCCIRCGSSKHFQGQCPYKPPRDPNRPLGNNRRAIGSEVLSENE